MPANSNGNDSQAFLEIFKQNQKLSLGSRLKPTESEIIAKAIKLFGPPPPTTTYKASTSYFYYWYLNVKGF
jgi:hypothetical protein